MIITPGQRVPIKNKDSGPKPVSQKIIAESDKGYHCCYSRLNVEHDRS